MQEQLSRTAQVRVLPGHIVDGHAGGTIVWMTPARARMFASMRVIEVIGAPVPPVVGPTETKEVDAKKSFDARGSGHSTDSASSSLNGEGQQSSASVEAQVSPKVNAIESEPSVNGEGSKPSEQLPSTTPTDSPRGQTSRTSRTRAGGKGTVR